MDIHKVRQDLKSRNLYDIPMRVTFYARVSSESDEQLNSLGNQISYYQEMICKNQAWTFVPGYIDEGISGISTKKRENFHRMIEDAGAGRFDLILTKEITRFARNTLDSIQYTRQLLRDGVGVFFQNDNINTLDEDSELRLTIMSGIAQDELRKLSSRIRFGHQQAIKNHVVLGNNRIFGYRKEDRRLAVDPEEAPMVRELYELYATGAYSLRQLENRFWEEGYRNHNGNRIAHTTMSGMISNPKYKGFYVGNKVRVLDMFTKKQKFLPPEEWVMFRDETGEIVPAIVSEELWDAANAVLEKRSRDVKGRQGICNHTNLLTGKLYCTHCGAPYYRRDSVDRRGRKNSKWVCSGKIRNGANSCDSFAIYENEIRPLLFEAFQNTQPDVEAMIQRYTDLYRSLDSEKVLDEKIAAQKKIVETTERKKSKLLTYNAMGELSDRDFLTMNRFCTEELETARQTLEDLTAQHLGTKDFNQQMEKIRRTLRSAARDASDGMITRNFVERYIDRIDVTPLDGDSMLLEIRPCTGETVRQYLKNQRSGPSDAAAGRTGHIFLTICPPTEPASLEVRSPL